MDSWLHIPAEDYEAHMEAVGQTPVLRALFARLYADTRPTRLAVLGCTTGGDLRLIDPKVTEMAVGVDINAAYLDIARTRLASLGSRLRLIHADVLEAELPGDFDVIHAALVLEYVDPAALFARIFRWLSPGGLCSVVTQEPAQHVGPVSNTGYASLQNLSGCMTVRPVNEVVTLAARAGFVLRSSRLVDLGTGKTFAYSLFERPTSATRS